MCSTEKEIREVEIPASLPQLRHCSTVPADFEEFWDEAKLESERVEPSFEVTERYREPDGSEISILKYATVGGVQVGAYLRTPQEPVTRVLVRLPGYGGLEEPEPTLGVSGTAELIVVPRGIPTLSLLPDIPSEALEHVLHGIESRETYVIRGCVQDAWCALALLPQLFDSEVRVDLVGTSFGGGLAPFVLLQAPQVVSGMLYVPTFGSQEERVLIECDGSGHAVREYWKSNPEVIEVLRYFDAATAASKLTIPVLVAAARQDPMVPPLGQMAIYNALPGPKMLLLQEKGHSEHDRAEVDVRVLHATMRGWLEGSQSVLS